MININTEVVGLIFGGNIESLPGRYIYTTEANRTLSVDTRGLFEARKNVYRAELFWRKLQTVKYSK
jgi:hypothetical protein